MEAMAIIRSGSPRVGAGMPSLRRCGSVVMMSVKPRVNVPLRRAISEAELIGSGSKYGSVTSTMRSPRIAEEEEVADGFSNGGRGKQAGGGGNGNRGRGERPGSGSSGNGPRIREYYEKMLRSDPGNPLLLRNYGKYLHEVEGDLVKAEEYYGRAILASPGDGEVLSLYGRLVWESQREKQRAGDYFERAIKAAPDDCYVLGSYASFLWDAEEDEEEEDITRCATASLPLMQAC